MHNVVISDRQVYYYVDWGLSVAGLNTQWTMTGHGVLKDRYKMQQI